MCLERGSAKQTRLSCEKGRINMACTWIWEVLYLAFGEIFSASQMSLQRTEESTPKIGFALMNGRFCNGTNTVLALWVYESIFFFTIRVCACVCACECLCDRALSSENQQKPVISHVNAGWKANMRINWGTYHNNTWKMEQSFFLQSKARLFITLGRCLVASLVCLLWALKLI